MKNTNVLKRLIAYIIDLSLINIPGIFLVLYATQQFSINLSLLVPIISLSYLIVMSWKNNGRTLGKMLLKLQLVSVEGGLTLQQIIKRYFLLEIGIGLVITSIIFRLFGNSLLSFLIYALYIGAMFRDKKHQGFHDKFAKTQVIDYKK